MGSFFLSLAGCIGCSTHCLMHKNSIEPTTLRQRDAPSSKLCTGAHPLFPHPIIYPSLSLFAVACYRPDIDFLCLTSTVTRTPSLSISISILPHRCAEKRVTDLIILSVDSAHSFL